MTIIISKMATSPSHSELDLIYSDWTYRGFILNSPQKQLHLQSPSPTWVIRRQPCRRYSGPTGWTRLHAGRWTEEGRQERRVWTVGIEHLGFSIYYCSQSCSSHECVNVIVFVMIQQSTWSGCSAQDLKGTVNICNSHIHCRYWWIRWRLVYVFTFMPVQHFSALFLTVSEDLYVAAQQAAQCVFQGAVTLGGLQGSTQSLLLSLNH